MSEMMRTKSILLSLTILLSTVCVAFGQKSVPTRDDFAPTVILLSIDGFRYDYPEKHGAPTIAAMARDGVRAKWMNVSFPTKTFPNHYTVATGLYPANNGIVDNNVFAFGTVLSMSRREEVENSRWWLGEPIWVTAENQGLRAASFFFVGSEAPVKGVRPTFWRRYNGGVPPQMRVDTVLSWLDLPEKERPRIITFYFSDTDDAGHEFGPDAEETKYSVWNVDSYVKRLTDGIEKRGLKEKVNIILVSDHGMASVDYRNVTFLDEHFSLELAERILWSNEVVHIFPKAGKTDEIHNAIKNLEKVTCWKKDEIPARFNYKGSDRIAPIVCMSDEGWITTSRQRYSDWMRNIADPERPRGAHGYDPGLESMRGIFMAWGPAFKKGHLAEPIENVDVYNLMCRILGLRPAQNDGDFDRVKSFLKN
jgi:predicted AlkP superfamily pyrophosphatase or phosphodiesterase